TASPRVGAVGHLWVAFMPLIAFRRDTFLASGAPSLVIAELALPLLVFVSCFAPQSSSYVRGQEGKTRLWQKQNASDGARLLKLVSWTSCFTWTEPEMEPLETTVVQALIRGLRYRIPCFV